MVTLERQRHTYFFQQQAGSHKGAGTSKLYENFLANSLRDKNLTKTLLCNVKPGKNLIAKSRFFLNEFFHVLQLFTQLPHSLRS